MLYLCLRKGARQINFEYQIMIRLQCGDKNYYLTTFSVNRKTLTKKIWYSSYWISNVKSSKTFKDVTLLAYHDSWIALDKFLGNKDIHSWVKKLSYLQWYSSLWRSMKACRRAGLSVQRSGSDVSRSKRDWFAITASQPSCWQQRLHTTPHRISCRANKEW